MTEPSTARPDPHEETEGQPTPDSPRVERARRATQKRTGPLAETWPRQRAAHTAAPPTPSASAPTSSAAPTPLQHLLDPAQGVLARETPIQPRLTSSLPEWNDLTTRSSLEHLPDGPSTHPPTRHHTDSGRSGSATDTARSPSGVTFGRHGQSHTNLTTLDETVVTALIQALHDALPDDLEQAVAGFPETTPSGNVIGRGGWRRSTVTSEQGAGAASSKAGSSRAGGSEAGTPQPRQFVRGVPDPGTVQASRQQLSELALDLPPEGAGALLEAREVLGHGEACFLRAQSALWAWRTHRQANLYLHTDGPPMQGRNVLIEQRVGPLTLLLGGRVTRLLEHERHWGFTLGSLNEQVLRSQETFLIEWQADDTVVFSLESRQQLALPSLGVLASVHGAVRRMNIKGYLRNMRDMTAAADDDD